MPIALCSKVVHYVGNRLHPKKAPFVILYPWLQPSPSQSWMKNTEQRRRRRRILNRGEEEEEY
jgi:hypothetical protein